MAQGKMTITDRGVFLSYSNIGSDRRGQQAFRTEQEAREFCRSRLITIVQVFR